MVPITHFVKYCQEKFIDGEVYAFAEADERSLQSHNEYFALLDNAHANLSGSFIKQFPTREHMRKHALIKAGYCNKTIHPAHSEAEALRVLQSVIKMDCYAFVEIAEDHRTTTIYTAESQKEEAMGRKLFQESKEAVLDIVAGWLGVSVDDLRQNTRTAA